MIFWKSTKPPKSTKNRIFSVNLSLGRIFATKGIQKFMVSIKIPFAKPEKVSKILKNFQSCKKMCFFLQESGCTPRRLQDICKNPTKYRGSDRFIGFKTLHFKKIRCRYLWGFSEFSKEFKKVRSLLFSFRLPLASRVFKSSPKVTRNLQFLERPVVTGTQRDPLATLVCVYRGHLHLIRPRKVDQLLLHRSLGSLYRRRGIWSFQIYRISEKHINSPTSRGWRELWLL